MITPKMILICSGAYISSEFIPEVGRIPPSFLPIGNNRLYEYQVNIFKNVDYEIYLSIPETYEVPSFDIKRLKELNVNILRVPENISLGSSILYCWLAIGINFKSIIILLGDTLFTELNFNIFKGESFINVHANRGIYNRAKLKSIYNGSRSNSHLESELVNDDSMVISGLFSFERPWVLMQGITKNNNDFIEGINYYQNFCETLIISEGRWLDFGHLNSFFISRSEMTTQRSFNSLYITKRLLYKKSSNKLKMQAEASWYSNIPLPLTLYTPKLLNNYTEEESFASYTLEYLYLLPLNDLYVFGELPLSTWNTIFEECREILSRFKDKSYISNDLDIESIRKIYLHKSIERLRAIENTQIHSFINSLGYDLFGDTNSVELLLNEANKLIENTNMKHLSIIHGDFCFSNILLDNRSKTLKLIDPRGMDSDGKLTIFGDQRYDISKLYHSVVGMYDFIISGRYRLEEEKIIFDIPESVSLVEKLFDDIFFKTHLFVKKEIVSINFMLFISMLPLHDDRIDRQKALFVNALRIFQKVKSI